MLLTEELASFPIASEDVAETLLYIYNVRSVTRLVGEKKVFTLQTKGYILEQCPRVTWECVGKGWLKERLRSCS